MIYLTGDVHIFSGNNWEQKSAGSELTASKRYLSILKKYKISSTLFLNGKLLENNPVEVKELLDFDVEIGGHTYNNFGKMGIIKSYLNRKIFGAIYGSKGFQARDIKRTKNSFDKLGIKMDSWRTHAFGSNNNTFILLGNFGIKYVSDLVGDIKPLKEDKTIQIPINIPIDQNTISYGKLSPENHDPFASCTKNRISKEEWFEILKKRIIKNEKENVDSVILIHPITMAALDNFVLFEEIAKFLSKY